MANHEEDVSLPVADYTCWMCGEKVPYTPQGYRVRCPKCHGVLRLNPYDVVERADKALNEFIEIAENLGIKPFLWAGTCLGFVRDDGYIKNDGDIDIGVIGDLNGQPITEVSITDILVAHEFRAGGRYPNHRHFFKYDIALDIFFKFNPEAIEAYFQPFETVSYKGKEYMIPAKPYLEAQYGPNWRTPKIRWEK